jgi:hypothetical protein
MDANAVINSDNPDVLKGCITRCLSIVQDLLSGRLTRQ